MATRSNRKRKEISTGRLATSGADLYKKYPPSEPCTCAVCRTYCQRPGWWTVEQATKAISAGLAFRMMLEIAPELTFGVLSPAFKGCEAGFANYNKALDGCTFLNNDRCELFDTGYQPLECRYCHHDRPGMGKKCHADLEKNWNSADGVALVVRWCKMTGLWEKVIHPMSQ